MIITKKALPRRTFLKGAGQAALALPLLDAMIPAATAWAQTPAKPVPRLGFVFIPMGCDHSRWIPPAQEKLTELFSVSAIKSITVLRMEVPCCGGIVMAARQALTASGKELPFHEVTITIGGEVKG